MNYVEYTENAIKTHSSKNSRVLGVGAGYNVKPLSRSSDRTVISTENKDLSEWCEYYRNSDEFKLVDLVIMSRVLEHLPLRKVDWHLFNLYTVMGSNSKLICVIPDMPKVAQELEKEFHKPKGEPSFRMTRLTFELFSEGEDVRERHCLWTSESSIKYYLEREKLFKVIGIRRVTMDSSIVPLLLEVMAERA